MTDHAPSSLESQVAENTANISSLTRDVTMLAKSVNDLRTTVQEGFSALAERFSKSREVHWGTIFAGGGFVLGAVGVASALIVAHVNGSVSLERAALYAHEREAAVHLAYIRRDLEKAVSDIERNTNGLTRFRALIDQLDVRTRDLFHKNEGRPLPYPTLDAGSIGTEVP